MKRYIFGAFLASCLIGLSSCSNDDKLSDTSVLIDPEVDNSTERAYLDATFKDTYGIHIVYKWDRNQYGDSRDVLRNLYPAKRDYIIPAMEMVNHVWIKTYEEVAGKDFINDKVSGPYEFVLAGGQAINDTGSRTLGLATSGVRVTLFELDYIIGNPAQARQFIHTIQHEYIHIINQDKEFIEKDYGKQTMADYNPNWERTTLAEAREKGFISAYATNNIFEDFAEMASFLMSNTKEEYEQVLESYKVTDPTTGAVTYKPGRAKLIYKEQFIRNYFNEEFNIDFDELCRVANENAASSPMLNPNGGKEGFGVQSSAYGVQIDGTVRSCPSDKYWKDYFEKREIK